MILSEIELPVIRKNIENFDGVFLPSFLIFHESCSPNTKSNLERRMLNNMEVVRLGKYFLCSTYKSIKTFRRMKTEMIFLGDVYDNNGADLENAVRPVLENPNYFEIGKLDLGGRYVCIIFNGDDILIFNDPMGTRSISYVSDGRFIVSSHTTLLRRFFKLPLRDGIEDILSSGRYLSRSVNYLPGDYTIYSNVNRLTPNHLLDSRHGAPVRYWPVARPEPGTEGALYEKIDACLRAFFKYCENKYTPVLPVTGGVDSRAIISYALGKVDLNLYTWKDLNFKEEENESIEEIVKFTCANHYQISVKRFEQEIGPSRATKVSLLARLNSGMTSKDKNRALAVMGISKHVRCPESLPPVTVIGYGGEIIRGFYMKNKRDNNVFPSSQTLMALYGLGRQDAPADINFSRFCSRAFREFRVRTLFTEIALKDWSPFDMFYWEHRMGIWGSSTLDAIDVGNYAMVALNSRQMFAAALALPNGRRLDKSVLLRYVSRNSPRLGSIPLF